MKINYMIVRISILNIMLILLMYHNNFAQKPKSYYNSDIYTASNGFVDDLLKKGIDTIIFCRYQFDNGIFNPTHFIIWQNMNKGHLKLFIGSSSYTEFPEESFDCKELISYFFKNRIDTIKSLIKTNTWHSHDMGYFISLIVNKKIYSLNVRDYQRNENKTDPRCIWVNMIDEKSEEYK